MTRFKARNHPQQRVNPYVDDRATTPAIFAALHARFRFTVDVAAAAHNAKLPRFFDESADGLAQSWARERVWCNPPYSNIRPWVEKAWHERTLERGQRRNAQLVVMLLPANRTEQGWWQELIEPALRARHPQLHVEFLPGRLRFLAPGQTEIGPNQRPPFGCCLVIWGAP